MEEARSRGDQDETGWRTYDHYAAVTELHRRITFAFMVLTFPLAGVCLALFLNSPNRLLPVFVGLMVVPAVFYVLEMQGNAWARNGRSPWLWEEMGNLGLVAPSTELFTLLRRRTVW